MPVTDNLRFTQSHEWVKLEGDIATIGISDHAQDELGDVALVQFPEVGRVLQQDEKFGEIESIKAVSDLFAPVSGVVVEVNDTIDQKPESVNNDPYGEGWIIKLRILDVDQYNALLSSTAYDDFLKDL